MSTAAAMTQALLCVNRNLDPLWAQVKALLHFDGDLTDSATGGPTYSLLGNAVISATDPIAGTGSLDCSDPVGVNGVSSTANVGIALGTDDFCIELVVKQGGSAGANPWIFYHLGSVNDIGLWILGGNMAITAPGGSFSAAFPDPIGATPSHIAVTRYGNLGTVWFDGVSRQTWDLTGVNFGTGFATSYIGRSSGAGDFRLIIDEWRVTIGNARYTSSFTPTYPFPNE